MEKTEVVMAGGGPTGLLLDDAHQDSAFANSAGVMGKPVFLHSVTLLIFRPG